MEFKIYCEECMHTLEDVSELERKICIGGDYDFLCCPYCKRDYNLKLVVNKESH